MGLKGTGCKASLRELSPVVYGRGLKCQRVEGVASAPPVAPLVGARIEILVPFGSWQGSPIAPLVRARIET